MPILSLRFLVESLFAIAIGFAMFTFGWAVAAESMLRFAAAPLTNLVSEGPSAFAWLQFRVGLVCATPPLFAWLAGLVYRLRTRAQPSWLRLVTCLATASIAVALGFAVQLLWVRAALADSTSSATGIHPMISIGSLSPAYTGLRFGIVVGVVLLLINARRPVEKLRSPSSTRVSPP